MRFLLLLGLSVLALFSVSCQPEVDLPSPPIPSLYDGNLQVVWSRYFHVDSMDKECFFTPIIWNDYIIIASKPIPDHPKPRGIRVFNKNIGIDHPAWQGLGEIVDKNLMITDFHIGGTNNDIIFANNEQGLYAVNLNTGKRLWKINPLPNLFIHTFSMLGNTPMVVYNPIGALSESWCRIAKIDLATNAKIDLVDLSIKDNYEFTLRPPSWTTNLIGDTLILFLRSGYNFNLAKGDLQVYCYNITQKKMEWEKRDFVKIGRAHV